MAYYQLFLSMASFWMGHFWLPPFSFMSLLKVIFFNAASLRYTIIIVTLFNGFDFIATIIIGSFFNKTFNDYLLLCIYAN